MKQTNNLENFRHLNFQLLQIGFKIAEYNSQKILRRREWFLMEYPWRGGFSKACTFVAS